MKISRWALITLVVLVALSSLLNLHKPAFNHGSRFRNVTFASLRNRTDANVAMRDAFLKDEYEYLNNEMDASQQPVSADMPLPIRVPLPGFPGFDPRAPTVLAQLGGEMANNLSFLAMAFSVIWDLEKIGVNATLVVRHQSHSKWVRGDSDVHRCFPWLSQFNFSAGFIPEIDAEIKQNNVIIWETDVSNLTEFLNIFEEKSQAYAPEDRISGYVNRPLLVTNKLAVGPSIWSRYYHELRYIMNFDTENDHCCRERPDPGDTVFHFRDFRKEMPRQWNRKQFWEAGPNRAAKDLLDDREGVNISSLVGQGASGQKVAITSRFGVSGDAPEYVKALERRGIAARIVSGQSGPQDFCFLLHTKHKLVGVSLSTFTTHAAWLGNATEVVLYVAKRTNYHSGDHIEWENRVSDRAEMERIRFVTLENVTDWRRP